MSHLCLLIFIFKDSDSLIYFHILIACTFIIIFIIIIEAFAFSHQDGAESGATLRKGFDKVLCLGCRPNINSS